MTARDRMIIVVVLVVAALGAFWFVGLSPKRKEAADLQSKINVAQEQLTAAEQKASQARQAKARYTADYAEVATLGKAVPKSDALPSLLYQLQSAAQGARINFNSLKVSSNGAAATPVPAAATAAVANASGGSGTSTPAGSTTSSSKSSGSGSSTATPPPTTPAPATQAASSALPPGATIGSAGFPTMPFSFVFNGTFFDMEQFLHDVQRFVTVNGQRIDVSGRLLSVDGFGLSAGPGGFPNVKATISATAYLRSPEDDVVPTDSTGAAGAAATPAPATTAGVTQ
jgi:type II secretion system (T2SS) protein M